MAVFNNKTFTRENIVLDGSEFYDCTFNECYLTYSGGSVQFKAKAFRCHWIFGGAAHNTVALLRYLGFLSATGELNDWPMDT
jgi:hypothetical protein